MNKIVPIVEGTGEVGAVPILVRKLLGEMGRWDIEVVTPKNAHSRNNLLKVGGIERFIQLVASESDRCGILVLLDADKQCAVELATGLAERIRRSGCSHPAVVVCATREYEAWFLASLESLVGRDIGGKPGLPDGLVYDGEVEDLPNAKEWLSKHFPGSRAYKETLDQPPLTHHIAMDLALRRSRSFRRLYHAIEELVAAVDDRSVGITP